MKIINNTPFVVLPVPGKVNPPATSVSLVVKGTFDLVPGGICTPATQQCPIEGDRIFMDEIGRSLEWPSDRVAFKSHSDFFICGSFHQPGGTPAPAGEAGFSFGPLHKVLSVFGPRLAVQGPDRSWVMTAPEPFVSLPLRWEYSFGGMSDPRNPLGMGIDPQTGKDGIAVVPLPRIENRAKPMRSLKSRPEPVNFAPVPASFAQRQRKLGTRDQRWALFRAPLPPVDYDPSYHNVAPADQQGGNYPRGDETLTLRNLHRDHPALETRLPGLRPLAAVVRRSPAATAGEDVALNLDTVAVLPDQERLILVWRGVIPQVRAARELVALQLEMAPLDTPPRQPTLAETLLADYLHKQGEPARRDAAEQAVIMEQLRATLAKAKVPAALMEVMNTETDPRKLHAALLTHIDGVIDATLAKYPAAVDKVPQLKELLATRASQRAEMAV